MEADKKTLQPNLEEAQVKIQNLLTTSQLQYSVFIWNKLSEYFVFSVLEKHLYGQPKGNFPLPCLPAGRLLPASHFFYKNSEIYSYSFVNFPLWRISARFIG